jgi:signal transduction histidine kinase/CheY-like chemotaxis protein
MMKFWLSQMKFKPYSICYLIVGLTVTFCVDGLFWNHSQRELSELHEKKSTAAEISAHDMLLQHQIIIRSIHSFFNASKLVTNDEFTEFTQELLKITSATAFTIGVDNKLAFISNPAFENDIKEGKFIVNGAGLLTYKLSHYSSFITPIDQPDLRYMVYVISHAQVLERLNHEQDICLEFTVAGKVLSNHYCQTQLPYLQRALFYFDSHKHYYGSEFNAENYTLKTWYSPPTEEINEVLLIIFLFSITGIGFSVLMYLKVEQRNMLYKMRIETESKVAVLSAINHEIRTPINAVLGYSRMLKDSGCCVPQGQMTVNKIIWSANLLYSVAENTLNFSKASTDNLTLDNKETDLRQLIENIEEYYTAFSQTHDKTLSILINKPLPPKVAIDSTKLYQLVTNIINNAFKYSTGKQVNCHLDLKNYHNSPFLRVAIRDFGKGMSEASMEAITRPFTTELHNISTLQSGIGIGLYTCKQVIEKVGGKISIRSRAGQGTLVIIRFPFEYIDQVEDSEELEISTNGVINNMLNDEHVPAKRIPHEKVHIISAQKKSGNLDQSKQILLVDDNLFNLEVCKAMLEKEGFDVTTRSDAESTKQYFAEVIPDIVLMDYRLAESNGLTLIDDLIELHPNSVGRDKVKRTHYFILSANDKEEISFHEEYPDVFFMQKPLNMDVFVKQLSRIYAVN